MTTGATTFQGLPDFKNPVEAARAWADVYEQKQQIETQTKLQQKELQIAAPKVKYYENVLQSNSTYNTNQIAKELGMSAVTLNKKLNKLGVQYKQNKTWLLYHKYQNKSLTKTKTFVFTDTEGNERTRMQTVWTEKGRLFINEKKALL
jgi:anti-repressor protein